MEILDGTLVEVVFFNGTIAFLTSTDGTFVLLIYSLWYTRVLFIYSLLITNLKQIVYLKSLRKVT